MKLKGASYADIASKGGGILNSARKLQAMSEDELYERALVACGGDHQQLVPVPLRLRADTGSQRPMK